MASFVARPPDDPYGFAFGAHRSIYGYRPGWPYQALPRPAVNPPTPPAFLTPLRPGWGSSGWSFGQGVGQPPGQAHPIPGMGVQGLRNWVPPQQGPVTANLNATVAALLRLLPRTTV
jgi:hypothetical protein